MTAPVTGGVPRGGNTRPAARRGLSELQWFLLKRAGQVVIVLVSVATLTFFLVRITGDPVKAMLPDGATLEQEHALRASLGLDHPLWEQFVAYMGGLVRFDVGKSLMFRQPALDLIAGRLPATLLLAAGAMTFALIVSIPIGIIAAIKRGKAVDSAAVGIVLVGQSTPAFFVGILLIMVFAVALRWLPANGIGSFANLILPSITLGMYSMAMIARLLRSSLIDVLGEEYIRTATSKGLSPTRVVLDHGLRNAALPVVTIVGLEFGSLLGGAILTEQVFSWPGVGQLTVQAIANRDFPLVQAIVLFLSLIFVVTSFLVDIAYAFLDPRVRLG